MTAKKFEMFFPLSKIEEQPDGTLRVFARGTQEIPDRANEIMDYDTTAPNVMAWSNDVYKDTGGKSYGNIRVMHNPDLGSAGILSAPPILNDEEKAVDLVIDVLDKNEILKVKGGCYSGVSMGGKYVKRWNDPDNYKLTRFTGRPEEWSLVDRPCVPTALIQMVKMDGTIEMVKVISPAPIDEEPKVDELAPEEMSSGNGQVPAGDVLNDNLFHAPDSEPVNAGELPTPAGVVLPAVPEQSWERPDPAYVIELLAQAVSPTGPKPGTTAPLYKNDVIEKFIGMAETFSEAVNKLDAIRKADAEQKEKLEKSLKAVGSRVGIARREGEPLAAPHDYPSDPNEYGDPANWNYPVTKANVLQAVERFNGKNGVQKYSPSEWNVLGRRIARLASNQGVQHSYNPTDKHIYHEVNKMDQTVQKIDAGAVLAQLSAAMKTAADMIGKDPQAAQDLLMAALGGADPTAAASATVPTLTGNAETIKAAGSGTPTMTSSTQTEVAPLAPTEKATLPLVTAPSSPSGSESGSSPSTDATTATTETKPSDAFKAMQDQVATLTAMVAKLLPPEAPAAVPVPAPVQKVAGANPLPAANLQALVNATPKKGGDIIKALRDGGAGAFQKALKAANGDEALVYRTMNETMNKELVDMGISSAPYQIAGLRQ